MLLSAVLSERLRRIYGPKVADWPSVRLPEAIKDMPEHHYTGQTLGPRYRRMGKHN